MLDLFDADLADLGAAKKKAKKLKKPAPKPAPQLPVTSVSEKTKKLVLGGAVLLVIGAAVLYVWRSR